MPQTSPLDQLKPIRLYHVWLGYVELIVILNGEVVDSRRLAGFEGPFYRYPDNDR